MPGAESKNKAARVLAPISSSPKVSVSLLLISGALILAGSLVVGIFLFKSTAQKELAAATREMSVPSVLTVHPEESASDMQMTLPGAVTAQMETPIYSRVDGYLKRWTVDIGSEVKQGQLLAEIETPETDQALAQALASQEVAQTELALAQTTALRWSDLFARNAVSTQENDQKKSELEVKKSALVAAQANVKRLQELVAFQKVLAPFDGIITARNLEVGNLVSSGSAAGAQMLFSLAQTRTLRVLVNVPEARSSEIKIGTKATLNLASVPGRKITGTVVRTSGSINPTSLTMRAEVEVANTDGVLLPGGYAQVSFETGSTKSALLIPANTLIFRSQGVQVGIVERQNNSVHLVSIKIGRDLGSRLEVVEGLNLADNIILNPSDSLTEGAIVRIENPPKKSP